MTELSRPDYTNLLEFRTTLRRFERWSEDQARRVGLTSAQHQLLLAIKGHPDDRGPTISEVADYLMVRHHSAVGLIDRAVRADLVVRIRDETDSRAVRLALTTVGAQRVSALSELHFVELARLAPAFDHLTAISNPEPTSEPTSGSTIGPTSGQTLGPVADPAADPDAETA